MKPRIWLVMEKQYFRPPDYAWDMSNAKDMSAKVAMDCADILQKEAEFRLISLDESDTLPEPEDTVDAVLVKGRNDWFLSKLLPFENSRKVKVIVNRPSAVVRYRSSKLLSEALLRGQGVPTPLTFPVFSLDEVKMLPDSMFPIILKPNRGRWGEGIQTVKDRSAASHITNVEMPCCAQRFIPNDQKDRKLFVVGKKVLGTIKDSPLVADMDQRNVGVQSLSVSKEMERIALLASKALELPICGVDMIEDSQGNLFVVDVNDFSSFIGAKDASKVIAQYVLSFANK